MPPTILALAIARRLNGQTRRIGSLVIDGQHHYLVGPDGRVELSIPQWQIILELVFQRGQIGGAWVSGRHLAEVADIDYGSGAFRNCILRIRRKLRAIGCDGAIQSRQAIGYRLVGG